MQRAHLHKRPNRRCKNQASGRGDSDFFSISVSVNGGITTSLEIDFTSATKPDDW